MRYDLLGAVMIDRHIGGIGRVGGGRGDRLPRTDSNAHDDPAPGQSDDRGVYRSGGDVTAPVLLNRTNPEYTELARTAKYQGTVLLSAEIDPSGIPTNLKVQRGLGLGLNEKAIESVKQWKFKPGQKGEMAVSVQTTVEVIFRLP
jgi:protein TonB